MQPDSRKYLYDIQTACRKLEDFTRDRSLDDYLANEMLRSAVERQFEIIGEARSVSCIGLTATSPAQSRTPGASSHFAIS